MDRIARTVVAAAAVVVMSSGATVAQFKGTIPHSSPMPAMPAPAMPAPAMPSMPSTPSAPPMQVVPPPPIRDTRTPDSGGADACDCYVNEQVPIMSNGRVISYENRSRWVGKNVQCCPSR
jgi:hypothetical protein